MAYDPRSVNISKMVKRVAATILDKNFRREFIRGYVKAEEAIARSKTRSNRGDRTDS